MALADILQRIDRDAGTDAERLVAAAETAAEQARKDAESAGASYHTSELERAKRELAEEARTLLAGARLRGRDRVLAEKRELLARVFDLAVERIVALPDAEYVALMVREVTAASRGNERVYVGTLDADRLSALLPTALTAAGSEVTVAGIAPDLERGVVLEGERMRVEISPVALIESHRSELEASVTDELFGGESE